MISLKLILQNYRRENDGVVKSADVTRDDAGYRIKYSIDDKNIGEKIDSEIFVRGWSRAFIEKTFSGVITRNFDLNWCEIMATDCNYQYIVEITPNG